MARNKGSVGTATRIHGKSLTFVLGYHDKTTRANMANDKKFKKGPKKSAVGWTHASVAAVKSDGAYSPSAVGSSSACRAVVVEAVSNLGGQNAVAQDSHASRQL